MISSTTIIGLLFFVLPVSLFGENQPALPSAKLSVHPYSIPLGGQTVLLVEIETPQGITVRWPDGFDTLLKPLEIVRQTDVDTTRRSNPERFMLKKEYAVTSFDTGFHVIRPIQFGYRLNQESDYSILETNPLLIHIAGVKVNISEPIRDIKDIARVPVTWLEVLAGFALLTALSSLVYLFIWHRRKKRMQPKAIYVPRNQMLPPHRIALDELERLKTKKLWQQGKIKEYHTELTEIIRRYIEQRFTLSALEMTTFEILDSLDRTNLTSANREKLERILTLADFVKFAKWQPQADHHERSFVNAMDFVRETIPVAEEVVTPPVEEQSAEGGK